MLTNMTILDIAKVIVESVKPFRITRIVDTGECYVVCVCDSNDDPPLILPYSFTYNMEKGYYDVDNPEKRKKFFDGKLIYLDDSIWWNKKK